MSITTSVVAQGEFSMSVTVSPDHPRDTLAADVADAIADAQPRLDGSRAVQIWVQEVRDGDDARLAPEAHPYRDLLQLRRPLPAPPSGIPTRSFDPARDTDDVIDLNNKAFAWHPEQAGMTPERLAALAREPWFDADGFRILELEGRMAGFCWTKVHADELPPLGEIYVIAVHPDFQGRGLGGPMTLAGLEWLSDQGLRVAKLYVESDNDPARRTYDDLDFQLHSVNRAYTTAPS